MPAGVDSDDGLDPDFRKHRDRIATYVPRTIFPATGAKIVAEARRNNAPVKVLQALEALKQGHRFPDAQHFWAALGLSSGPRL